jgi:hypothetical protein
VLWLLLCDNLEGGLVEPRRLPTECVFDLRAGDDPVELRSACSNWVKVVMTEPTPDDTLCRCELARAGRASSIGDARGLLFSA